MIKKEVKGLLGAFVVLFTLRSFTYHPYNIPTGSMYNTLEVGDFPIVSKWIYGWSKYSFPALINPLSFRFDSSKFLRFDFDWYHIPFFKGRIGGKKPERGEVVVFNGSPKDSRDFIKRLIGLPGDKIQMKEGILHINGEPVKLEEVGVYTYEHEKRMLITKEYKETLPNGLVHSIIKEFPFGANPLDNTEEFTVPAGHYFFMGDNRDRSGDSRIMKTMGFIPEENIIGRAEYIFFSNGASPLDILSWIPEIRLERMFTRIK